MPVSLLHAAWIPCMGRCQRYTFSLISTLLRTPPGATVQVGKTLKFLLLATATTSRPLLLGLTAAAYTSTGKFDLTHE